MNFELNDVADLANRIVKNPNPTGNKFLDKRWQENVPHKPYYRLFYELTKRYKPDMVVELGGWQGTAAAHFAGGHKFTGVLTVDHHTDPGDEKHRELMLEASDEFSNLVYLQGWTVNEVADEQRGKHVLGDAVSAFPLVELLLKNLKIDILFIDSWHVKEYAEKDWKAYSPLLNKPSLVIVDDCITGTPGTAIDGVREFFEELPGEKVLIDNLNPGYPQGFMKHE